MSNSRFKRSTAAAVLLLLAPALTGCGTILFGGTTESITVLAEPGGSTVTTRPESGTFTTPATIELQRKNNYLLRFEQLGYAPGELLVQKKLRVGVLVLDLLFAAFPALVDAISGGLYELQPKTATISLTKINSAVIGPDVLEVTIAIAGDDERSVATIEASAPGVTLTIIPQN